MSNSNSEQNKNDLLEDISAHEKLIHEHRKFLEERLKSSSVRTHAHDALTAEKNVWDSIQTRELEDRLAAERDADARERKHEKESSLERWGFFVTIAITLSTIIFTLFGTTEENAEDNLKKLALAASIFGCLSAFGFVLGHRGSLAVDGLAKFLALSAAILAVGATGLLMVFGF
ncbi:hypothetical protein [Glutamicibacter arilaitensis]|uniref:hypothetical protein n=1 Tax=Glutamicibacter arilaitensis TaxID=256701 RepID=UPI003FD1124D